MPPKFNAPVDLSIVIVNWNSKELLRNCIASLPAGVGPLTFEIVVVDSGSFDGCEAVLNDFALSIRFIQTERNVGFAAANNCAIDYCCGDALVFLNPDTIAFPRSLQILCEHLRVLPDAGIVGPKLLNGDGSVQTTCIRAFPTSANQLLESAVLRRRFPLSRLWGMQALFGPSDRVTAVDAVSGACMMVRRAVFEQIGRFSEDYFMYSEDIDVCFRMHAQGWRTYFVPTAEVTHLGGGSSSQRTLSDFAATMIVESRWRYFTNTHSRDYAALYRFSVLVESIVRIGMIAAAWPIAGIFGRTDRIRVSFRKWVARLLWAVEAPSWASTFPSTTAKPR
jgi:GT2 family glycosyltransferase